MKNGVRPDGDHRVSADGTVRVTRRAGRVVESRTLALLVAVTGTVVTMPYIARQLMGIPQAAPLRT